MSVILSNKTYAGNGLSHNLWHNYHLVPVHRKNTPMLQLSDNLYHFQVLSENSPILIVHPYLTVLLRSDSQYLQLGLTVHI